MQFTKLKKELIYLIDCNAHFDAILLVAKEFMPEYLPKFQKFVDIANKMQGFTVEEIKERSEIVKEMFAELVSKIGLEKAQELYGCL